SALTCGMTGVSVRSRLDRLRIRPSRPERSALSGMSAARAERSSAVTIAGTRLPLPHSFGAPEKVERLRTGRTRRGGNLRSAARRHEKHRAAGTGAGRLSADGEIGRAHV